VCVEKEVQGERFSINGLTRGWDGRNAKKKVVGRRMLRGKNQPTGYVGYVKSGHTNLPSYPEGRNSKKTEEDE